jgi:hypothetical protein
MEGGEISVKSAIGKNGANAGGVMIRQSTFTMKGGTISDNSAQGPEAKGGGVMVERGIFTMEGGTISGNSAIGKTMSFGGGVYVETPFLLNGGRIQGGTDSDGFAANTISGSTKHGAALNVGSPAKWGTGGTYTKGGKPQAGGSDIGTTDDTLIAIPGK